jgi:membrane protease YdiL (CAAX protease family)
LREPSYTSAQSLADPRFQGQWWILGLALTSMLFNYILGEELPFRGVLLRRMAGVFGRWDWVANWVFFGLYHRAQDLGLAEHDRRILRHSLGWQALPHLLDGRDRGLRGAEIAPTRMLPGNRQ